MLESQQNAGKTKEFQAFQKTKLKGFSFVIFIQFVRYLQYIQSFLANKNICIILSKVQFAQQNFCFDFFLIEFDFREKSDCKVSFRFTEISKWF